VQFAGEAAPRPAVTNVGVRPTLQPGGPLAVESHVLAFDADAYGREVRLFFVDRLRDERQFASAEELAGQIARDVAATADWQEQHRDWLTEAVPR
jgi:riboflavin kinase/FMN adenylyltransferase